MRRFELSEGSSNKFWELGIEGAGYTVRYGKIGAEGQVQTKSFASEAAALKQAEKVIAEKLGKGYREIATTRPSKKGAPASTATRSGSSRASGDELPFSPQQRALLLPRRGEVEPPKPASLAKLWRPIHDDFLRIASTWRKSRLPFADRLANEDPPEETLEAAHEAACAIAFGVADGGTAPVRPVTAESFVRFWAAKEGPAFVIETAIHTLDSSRYAYRVRDDYQGQLQIRNRVSGSFYEYAIPGLWGAVRRWVATLDDAAYAEARTAAESLQTKKYEKELENKLVLAFAFPDEPTFANRAADAVLAAESKPTFFDSGVGFLAASLSDATRLEKLIEEDEIRIPVSFLPTLARNIGDRTPHLLGRAFELECLYGKRGPTATDKDVAEIAEATAETIALFTSSDAAAALAGLADAPGAGTAVAAFAEAHPALARDALARHAKTNKGGAAAKLLERLGASKRAPAVVGPKTTTPQPVRPLTEAERSTDERIAWTEEMRAAALLPRRSPRTTAAWDAIDAAAYAKEIRGYLHATSRFKGALKKSTVAADLWPHVARILAGQEGDGSPEAEAIVAALGDFSNDLRQRFSSSHQAMVSVWTAQHGVAFALKAVVAWGRLEAEGDPFSGPITVRRRPFLKPAWSAPRADVFQRLQLRLTQAPDEQYREALAAARTLFASAEPALKAILSFLFPEETSFDAPKSEADHYLLCSSRTPDVLAKLAAREFETPRWSDWTFSELAVHVPGQLVEVLGLKALPYLEGMRKQVGKLDEGYRAPLYEALDRALGALEGRDAFASLIAELGDWSRRPWVWARLSRRPALAVLAALDVLADTKVAPLGREVLAYLQHDHADLAGALASSLTTDEKKKLAAARVDATLPPWLAVPPAHWKPVKAPSFFSGATLPAIVLRSGEPLSPAQIEVVRLLMTHGQGGAHVELAQLRAAATPESLEAFALALFRQWLDGKAPAKEKWALASAARLGGDRFATELAPQIREWPGQGFHQRAELGLDALAAIGSDLALTYLDGIARSSKFEAITQAARNRIAVIASARGLTPEALADRLVPDLGLGSRGERTFDVEGRLVTARLSSDLEPMLYDAAGALLVAPPKTKAKAKAALAELTSFQNDARELAKLLRLRLETMMNSARRLSRRDFEQYFLEHPLVGRLARKVVWAEFSPGGPTTFRIAEDGTLAGADDAKLAIGDGPIGVVHPAELVGGLIDRWAMTFAEYEIIQPFEQLAREVVREPKAVEATIREVCAKPITTKSVRGLLGRGDWKKGAVGDGGFITKIHCAVGKTELSLRFEAPGLPVSESDIEHVTVLSASPDVDALTAIERSELARDLHSLLA